MDILKEAHSRNVQLILPNDFVVVEKPTVQDHEEQNWTEGIENTGPVIKAVGEVNWIDLQLENMQEIDLEHEISKRLKAFLEPPTSEAIPSDLNQEN